MPFNLIPLIVIVASFSVVIVICVRKFPDVANLDVERLPEDKLVKTKQRLLEERFRRVVEKARRRFGFVVRPLTTAWNSAQGWFRKKVGSSKAFLARAERLRVPRKKKETVVPPAEKADRVEHILADADAYFEAGSYTDAENKYLEVVRLDQNNSMAYRGLGKVYMKTGTYENAIKTFEFLLKLTPHDDTVFVKLGKTAMLAGNYEQAARYYEQALIMNNEVPVRHFELSQIYKELGLLDKARVHGKRALAFEPANPRYLDGLLEISIMNGIKKESMDLYKRLRLENPENKKLVEFKERLDALG